MSLKSTWVKRSTYLSLEGFNLNAFMLVINNYSRKGKKETTQTTKVCSKSVKQSKGKGLLSFAVIFFMTLNSFFLSGNFFFHFTIYVSLGMRWFKWIFIDLHCYTSLFPGLLSLLPSNAVSAASLSSRLWVIHAEAKKATSAPPSFLFLIFWTQSQRFFCGITNRIVRPVCFVRIWGLQE